MATRVRQRKSPYFYARKGRTLVLMEHNVPTKQTFSSEADAKRTVLELNDAWRAKGAKKSNPRKYDESRDDAGYRKLSDLKKGEFFKRKADARKVYRKGDYDRSERKYEAMDEDDISRSIYLKGDALVYVGFDY
jgi:hypothetical protein